MGLRIAAGAAAVAMVIALIAVFLASHHSAVGEVPAAEDQNVKAYQTLMSSDYGTMAGSTSNHCNTIDDTGCAAAVKPATTTLQKWVDDLVAFHTPSRYTAADGQLRKHLSQAIKDLNAAVSFQQAKNSAGFDFAMSAAVYERAWIDPITFAIEGISTRVAGSYHDAVTVAAQATSTCLNGTPGPADLACQRLVGGEMCSGAPAQACENDVQSAATRLQALLIGLLQNQAPSSLAARDAQVQADLAAADTALLAITDAMLSGDSAKAADGEISFAASIVNASTSAGLATG